MKTHRQRGITLITMVVVLAVAGLLSAAVSRYTIRQANQAQGRSLGAVLNEIARGVDKYRTTNLIALTGPQPVTVGGFADPYLPTTTELIAGGYLAQALNLNAANYRIEIARSPVGCVAAPGTPCIVWAKTTLTNPILEPDGSIPADRLNALVASVTNAGASFSGPPDPTIIVGGDGTWVVPNPDPAGRAGIVALVSGLGGTAEDWLRVNDDRNPNFQGPSVTGTQFDTPIKVVGTTCTPQGAFASAANGLVYCNAGIWNIYTGPIEVGAAVCNAEGALGVTSTGESLICVNSAWRDHLTYGYSATAYYSHGSTVVTPPCGVGLTPVATATVASASVIIGANNPGNNTGSFEAAIDPTSWLLSITGATGVQAGTGARALVISSCAAT